jgi:hypothetical protein
MARAAIQASGPISMGGKARAIDIMAAREEVDILRDDGIGADGDGALAIDHGAPADDGAAFDNKVWRIPDVGAGMDADARADAGAEHAEDETTPRMKRRRSPGGKNAPDDLPERAEEPVTERKRRSGELAHGAGSARMRA